MKVNPDRYNDMLYRRVGVSGLKLPAVSLGLWHNFGDSSDYDNSREMVLGAFDLGITHFDLANVYGPPAGSAEKNFGRILRKDLKGYRDEIIVSTKAGHEMWSGPYGEWGSRKYLLAGLDQSLKRLKLDYVDIFYHHRPDPDTPLYETMGALADIVRSGKALYVGISKYSPEMTEEAVRILGEMGVPLLIHQTRYNMFDRQPEEGLYEVLQQEGVGAIPFSPLAQGLLTDRYLNGIPEDSRAAGASVFLKPEGITPELLSKVRSLNEMALSRGQTLAQMALAWLLLSPVVASVIIGASRLSQIEDAAQAHRNLHFTPQELQRIDELTKE
ncbi:MAG: L-glyceraldehyde 3-phosphate reductase [Clostridiales bacterium]|nr:L-glyceraldehyde 3-phosphate reductase [Clostridiales bacterium]